jgi:WD40 repeat protein/serine/threonine protein kinase
MGEHFEIDEEVVARLPLPMARLARRIPNAKSSFERHLAGYFLWESGLKLLASCAVVEYAERPELDEAMAGRLKNLARPSIGHWWEFVRRLLPVLAEEGDEGFLQVRDLVLGRARDDLPRVAGLDAALLEQTTGRPTARASVRLTEMFDRLVSYRNREIGHGAAGQRSGADYERMARALGTGLLQLFARADVLAGRRLIFVDDDRRLATGDWLVDRFELIGESARRLESLSVPGDQSALLPLPQRVYLEFRDGSPGRRRCLQPLLCYQPESGNVYFLNGRRGKAQAEYLCYDGGELARFDLRPDHRALLSSVLGRPVDEEMAGRFAAESQAEEAAGEQPTPHPAPSERTLGEFELLSRLGRGGMGVVYRAWQPSLGRQVAVKCMIRSGDPRAEQRFAREIRTLGRVEHPNLVKVYTSGADGEQWFFAMELIEGAELSSVCEQLAGRDASSVDESAWREAVSSACSRARASEAVLSDWHEGPAAERAESVGPAAASAAGLGTPRGQTYIRRIVQIVERIADATHALHEAGVVHRDIKPGNVMITSEGQDPVLMDLGLAQVADEEEGRITRTRQFVGTLRYASPEQVLSASRVDRRSDVYSLGATLWELLTLRPLFGATNETPSPDLMLDIQHRTPESLRRYNAQVPRDLEAIVLKCLEKDRSRRYTTAADLAADLNLFLRGEPVSAQPPSLSYLATKYVRRYRLPLAAALATVLMLMVGGAASVYRINEERKAAIRARNREAAASTEAQNRAREAGALASRNQELSEKEAASRKEVERQLRHSRLAAYDVSLDRAGKLLATDNAGAARILEDPEQCPPELRDFTWAYHLREARRERWVAPAESTPIHRLTFLPEAFVFASAAADGTVRLWNAAESLKSPLAVFTGHDRDVWSIAVSPDGRLAASAGRDATVRLWDLSKQNAVAVLRGHSSDVIDVAFSPDGKVLASAGRDGTLRLWDVAKGTSILSLGDGAAPFLGVIFSPEGRMLAATSADRVLRVWESLPVQPPAPAALQPRRPPGPAPPDPPEEGPLVALMPDGKSVAIMPGPVVVDRDWNLKSPHEHRRISVEHGLSGPIAFSPDGLSLVAGCLDRSVRIWNALDGRAEARLPAEAGVIEALGFTPDGSTLAAILGGEIRLWDVADWREAKALEPLEDAVPTALAFSADSGTLTVGCRSGEFRQFDLPRRRVTRSGRGHSRQFLGAAISPDGAFVAAGQSDGAIRLFDGRTGAPLGRFQGHERAVSEVAFAPGGKLLASASGDGTVRIWDFITAAEVARFAFPQSKRPGVHVPVWTVAFAPDGKSIAAGGEDGVVCFWDVSTRKMIRKPRGWGHHHHPSLLLPYPLPLNPVRRSPTMRILNHLYHHRPAGGPSLPRPRVRGVGRHCPQVPSRPSRKKLRGPRGCRPRPDWTRYSHPSCPSPSRPTASSSPGPMMRGPLGSWTSNPTGRSGSGSTPRLRLTCPIPPTAPFSHRPDSKVTSRSGIFARGTRQVRIRTGFDSRSHARDGFPLPSQSPQTERRWPMMMVRASRSSVPTAGNASSGSRPCPDSAPRSCWLSRRMGRRCSGFRRIGWLPGTSVPGLRPACSRDTTPMSRPSRFRTGRLPPRTNRGGSCSGTRSGTYSGNWSARLGSSAQPHCVRPCELRLSHLRPAAASSRQPGATGP